MNRYFKVIAIMLLVLAGAGLFNLKHIVENKERQLKALQVQILDDQRSIRVLKAEWAYLNRPENIQNLAVNYLGLKPTSARQIYSELGNLPWRVSMAKIDAPLVDYVYPQTSPQHSPAHTANLEGAQVILFEGARRQPVDAISLLLASGQRGLP